MIGSETSFDSACFGDFFSGLTCFYHLFVNGVRSLNLREDVAIKKVLIKKHCTNHKKKKILLI